MPAIVLPCTCTRTSSGNPAAAIFQDERYGRGMRAHNTLAPPVKGGVAKARCTICSTEHTI